jgi:hypothetical protein
LAIIITIKISTNIFFIKKNKHIAKIIPELCKLIPSKKLNALIKSKKQIKVQKKE